MDNIQLVEKLQADKDKLFQEIAKVIIGQKAKIKTALKKTFKVLWISLIRSPMALPVTST